MIDTGEGARGPPRRWDTRLICEVLWQRVELLEQAQLLEPAQQLDGGGQEGEGQEGEGQEGRGLEAREGHGQKRKRGQSERLC